MKEDVSKVKRFCACGCGNEVIPKNPAKYVGRFCFAHRKSWRSEHRGIKTACHCGCGQFLDGFAWSRQRGQHIRMFVNGHNTRLRHKQTHPMWKGGTMRHKGYVLRRCDGHPRAWYHGEYVYEHVLVMEEHLGRYLLEDEVVHHINHKRADNRLDNLLLTTKTEHMKIHARERRLARNR